MENNKRKRAPMSDYKIYNDSIHGHMKFHPLILRIMHTPQFQRLRDLKQLGVAYFVYPSASHNRYEHSLGTCYLAGLLMDILYKDRPFPKDEQERDEWEKDKLCVEIAGLCHDLGHGPFSHLWETFLEKSTGKKWEHEESSIEIFDLMLKEEIKQGIKILKKDDENAVNKTRSKIIKDLFEDYGLKEEEIELIKNLIRGKKAAELGPEERKKKHYLYQIVNNADNDIDVDKFDYLLRDSKMLNVNIHFQPYRIMQLCRIAMANGSPQICFRNKTITDIADMFMARAQLFDKAYNHPKVKIMTEMVSDGFYFAAMDSNPPFNNFKDTDPAIIASMTDFMFYMALHWPVGDSNLKKGQKLFKRLLKREYYPIILTYVINSERNIAEETKEAVRLSILDRLKQNTALQKLTKEDIGITFVDIGIGGSNKTEKLQNVYVYGKENPDEAEKFNWNENYPSLMPALDKYLKRKAFVMYKGEDQSVLDSLNENKSTIEEEIDHFFTKNKKPKTSTQD